MGDPRINQADGTIFRNQDYPPFDNAQIKNYQFSTDELRVLNDCNRESFYQRSLPLSTILGIGTWYGVNKGYFRASPRFGASPKVLGAVIIGYLLGKFSYQKKCAEKLMNLPGSYIGHMLREKRNLSSEGGPIAPLGSGVAMLGASSDDVYSDAGPSSSLDLDLDRPTFAGFDESFNKPNDDLSVDPNILPKHAGISYDDLRTKHREEQAIARKQPYKLEESTPPIVRARAQTEPKNKYGDIMD